MSEVEMNISKMFSSISPNMVSGSQFELGSQAGRITWQNALKIAGRSGDWLISSKSEALAAIKEWAESAGAWDEAEIEGWSDEEALALLVQNVAADLRMIGSDDLSLKDCVKEYKDTDWDQESEYPLLGLKMCGRSVCGFWYGGV